MIQLFKELFKGLHLYEIILLLLGVFLFMLLCAGLVYFIIKKDEIKKLLWFFPIPILMIAYPSIQEIKIGEQLGVITKLKNDVIANPQDTVAKKKLEKVTLSLEGRLNDLEGIKKLAEANLILGNTEKVIDLTNKAFKKTTRHKTPSNPKKTDTTQLKNAIKKQKNELKQLKVYSDMATIQQEVRAHKKISVDTTILKAKINNIKWEDAKQKTYLNTQIKKCSKSQ